MVIDRTKQLAPACAVSEAVGSAARLCGLSRKTKNGNTGATAGARFIRCVEHVFYIWNMCVLVTACPLEHRGHIPHIQRFICFWHKIACAVLRVLRPGIAQIILF